MTMPFGAFKDLRGQARVIAEVRRMVDAWRGFPLGRAADAWPDQPPGYEPQIDGERATSETTQALLRHWFRYEPHTLSGADSNTFAFKYWPHQRRLVETFIYLHEVRGIRRTEQLWELAGVDPMEPQRDPWAKLGGQLATGSGKTKMMSLIIAWAYLNAVREGEAHLGLGRHSLVIAPGLFVKDRLLQDFSPERGTAVFFSDPVLPPELSSSWDLHVYTPSNCPLQLDPSEGALVVTNYHQLLRTRADAPDLEYRSPEERQMDLLFIDGDPQKLEAIQSPLIERFSRSQNVLVLNDEAHHVGDEPAHASFEQKQRDKARLTGEDEQMAMAWIRSIRRLNGSGLKPGRVGLQVDLSATLYEETGASKSDKGKVQFKDHPPFRHTAVEYDLPEAITDGIVKKPILERVEVRNKKTNQIEPLIRGGQPNAWETYRNLLMTGIERWKKVAAQMRAEGDAKKPILFIVCADKGEAREVVNYLAHGQATRDDLSNLVPKGFKHPETGEILFLDSSGGGPPRSTVIEINIGAKEEANDAEWEKIRQSVNAIDRDEIPDPKGGIDGAGTPKTIPNPYNVVVSVMMLKEGWDVRNVKVIVPLRACGSRTLTEQVIGRGLRKMKQPEIDDDGRAELVPEKLFLIEHESMKTILAEIDDLVEQKSGTEIDHTPEYVAITQRAQLSERVERDVRLVRFEGLIEVQPDWRQSFDVNRLDGLRPRLAWMEEIADTVINTFLKAAYSQSEESGQTFTLTEETSYRDFDHVVEHAYAIPLLKEMKTSFQHKNAVKSVVREFLERKTFAVLMGLPISFDKVVELGNARIALGNLARPEVIEGVRKALLPLLHDALTAERPASKGLLNERSAAELVNYQAPKKNVLDNVSKSTFERAAMDSPEERQLALLLDRAKDVEAWLYNHRHGVGYAIQYDWQGYTSKYYPDFVVRARIGAVLHNFIIEVKGSIDDRDKEKARRAVRYCEMLTEYDREPWHYLLLIEDPSSKRADIGWWAGQSVQKLADLWRRHETVPLFPSDTPTLWKDGREVFAEVPSSDQYRDALPVYDLAIAAGPFADPQNAEARGWMRLKTTRTLDRRMFVAKIIGRSMEPTITDGTWAVFRGFPAGTAPPPVALDGRRVVVQLRLGEDDPDLHGRYTLKRWQVAELDGDEGVKAIDLVPDNFSFSRRRLTEADGDMRVVAELVEVLG